MKRNQRIEIVPGDSPIVHFRIEDEAEGGPRNLIGADAAWLVTRGSRKPPIVALTSEDDDRLEVGGGDGIVTLHLDSELTNLDMQSSRATHYLVILGVGADGQRGSWTAATGTLTLTR